MTVSTQLKPSFTELFIDPLVASSITHLAIYFGLWQFRCYICHQNNLHNVVSDDFSCKLCE